MSYRRKQLVMKKHNIVNFHLVPNTLALLFSSAHEVVLEASKNI